MTLLKPKKSLKDLQKNWLKILIGFQEISRMLINNARSGRPRYVSLLNAFNKQDLSKTDLTVLPVINFWRGDSLIF